VPFFGARPFDRIDAGDVADLISALGAKGLAPKTIRNVIGTLSALFNFAPSPRGRWASTNPCDGAELPALPDAEEIRFLTPPELDKLIEHARRGAARGPLARCGLGPGRRARPTQLRPRAVRNAEVATLVAGRADGRRRRADVQAAGMDGAQAPLDDRAVCRLCAACDRGRDDLASVWRRDR
jgi:hypothetical protein